MLLTSDAFTSNDVIPLRFTGQSGNFSPPLSWSEAPAGVKSFALVCVDPDAPSGMFTHWVVFNIPADYQELKTGLPPKPALLDGVLQGKNDWGEIGYSGPDPPPGKPHRYYFKLFALDTMIDLPAGISHADLRARTSGHVLAEADLIGTYGT